MKRRRLMRITYEQLKKVNLGDYYCWQDLLNRGWANGDGHLYWSYFDHLCSDDKKLEFEHFTLFDKAEIERIEATQKWKDAKADMDRVAAKEVERKKPKQAIRDRFKSIMAAHEGTPIHPLIELLWYRNVNGCWDLKKLQAADKKLTLILDGHDEKVDFDPEPYPNNEEAHAAWRAWKAKRDAIEKAKSKEGNKQ
jgi:hypothetical protein